MTLPCVTDTELWRAFLLLYNKWNDEKATFRHILKPKGTL